MNVLEILLLPTDVLFFRDGRPIEGSLAGHGAAWPLPSVTNAALHAALHRAFPVTQADIETEETKGHGDHVHRIIADGIAHDERRYCRFGSLTSAGPFPVKREGESHVWYFPRPRDLTDKTLSPCLLPAAGKDWEESTLPRPLKHAVTSLSPPSKDDRAKAWLPREKFDYYLQGSDSKQEGVNDSDIFSVEHSVGIEIDPTTQAAKEKKFYSAQYLRLQEKWCLGQLAAARNGEAALLNKMLKSELPAIVVGGRRRVCMVASNAIKHPTPLPIGKRVDFPQGNGKHLVKWVLLSPAIWPRIAANGHRRRQSPAVCQKHSGGWLPNWINAKTGDVLLRVVSSEERRRRRELNNRGEGYGTDAGNVLGIGAKLVAALVPKPIVVTGWSLGEPLAGERGIRRSGAKSSHLAVPAGAVYYFEADTPSDAENLAAVLNWHGKETHPRIIKNRRSTLMGEKGFGLGVCGGWRFRSSLSERPGE
ncbi:MAG: hypothetical protein M2R45_03539 [Verrucomicrobia subdivision 3 bacterium]|nr:hypothetical protein [Limisphaerales bacterium]MCS1416484.1 hypothetical protein [Limisphaerales bacterium]